MVLTSKLRPKSKSTSKSSTNFSFLRSVLSARDMMARGLGMSFNGLRDLYATFGYAQNVTYSDMRSRYLRQDIVSRIVNAYPDAIWTRPPQIIEGKKNNVSVASPIDEAFWKLDEDIALLHYINRADRLAGIGKYSVLMLGFDDIANGSDLSRPVKKNANGLKLAYVQAYGYDDAKIQDYEDDAKSPYFGMPKTYKLSIRNTSANEDSSSPVNTITVHRTRVIHIADCLLDSDIEGYPILERVYNRLDDVEKTVGGSAEMFWLSGRKGMQIDVDKETQFTEADAEKLRSELEDFGNDLQRYIRTRGVNIKELGGHQINPEPVFNVIMSIISVATGIPQRIFIGSEQGKLASEQDRANWAIRLDERRKLHAEPRIIRPFITRMQEYGVLPEGRYTLEWPEAFRMSPLERAQTAAQQARAATNVARAIKDFKKPIEGVDYPINRPTATVSGGGAPFGKALALVDKTKETPPVDTKKPEDKSKKPGGNTPPAKEDTQPTPVVVPMEQILVKPEELLSRDEARQIIFARGELKSEGKIDGVMD